MRMATYNVWNSEKGMPQREQYVIDEVVKINEEKLDYVLMAGDFNCSDTSDVHRFLTGDCSLGNMEANPNWYDLALSYAGVTGTKAEDTLNFRENPRFKGNTIETNARVDRILLRNTYPHEFPTLKECTVYGERIYEDIGLSASDHYGVMAEIDWT